MASCKNKKILLVEDDHETRKVLEVLLANEGYKVISAANGLEALRKLDKASPDLVVSDVRMPVMDGVELCAVLRTRVKLPVVMITAYETPKRKTWDALFLKPIEVPSLLDRIRSLLGAEPSHA